MIILGLGLTLFLAFWFRWRISALESAVAELSMRVRVLERHREPAAPTSEAKAADAPPAPAVTPVARPSVAPPEQDRKSVV